MKLYNFILIIISAVTLGSPMNLLAEELIDLPRTEGSKSFDMEIYQLNNIGIKHYSINELDRADESLKKAANLAQQLRDPSLGVTSFNRAIVLHRLHKRKEALKFFLIAKRHARGNPKIINSQLLKNYTK